jgi:uncharacterized protein YbaP (TraB family)
MMRLVAALFLVLVALLLPARAAVAPNAPPAAARTEATPPIWRVKGLRGTVYLLGAVHALPPDIHWRTAFVDYGIRAADVFAFEIPDTADTAAKARELVETRGRLPPGVNLRDMLSPTARTDFETILGDAKVPLTTFDGMRPWLADVSLSFLMLQRRSRVSPSSGVDRVLAHEAQARGKEIRYMETAEQQMALVAPSDPKVELEAFETDLRQMRTQASLGPELIAAWARGDARTVDRLANSAFKGHDAARRLFLDDRNTAWVKKLKPWLDREDKVFFVTVGAAHLVGRQGVPALLKKAGYRVEGPPT